MMGANQRIKGIAVLLLCFGLIASATGVLAVPIGEGSLNNFQKKNVYSPPGFSDVPANQWFYDDVKTVYEYGLMLGTSASTFNPGGNVTIAETITVAARLHKLYYTGETSFNEVDPWYQAYVDYAKEYDIINEEYDNYARPATRAEYATILSASFPDEALEPINQIADGYVPDVKMDAAYSDAIYRLYRAGILTGNDDKGTFSPNSNIMRSEVAAILSRMANEEKRIVKKAGANQGDDSIDAIDTPAVEAAIHNPSFIIGSSTVKRGSKNVPITVALRKNPGIASIGLTVSFDNELTLKEVKYSDAFAQNAMLPQKMTNPVKLIWVAGTQNIEGDWTFATLYFDVAENATTGSHQIAAIYDEDDVFKINKEEQLEENVPFEVIFGSIIVTN